MTQSNSDLEADCLRWEHDVDGKTNCSLPTGRAFAVLAKQDPLEDILSRACEEGGEGLSAHVEGHPRPHGNLDKTAPVQQAGRHTCALVAQ